MIEAHGEINQAWTTAQVIMEIGYVFTAPEGGSFKTAIAWDIRYLLEAKHIFWGIYGQASIKVEYILYNSGYNRLESRTVLSDFANSDDPVSGGTIGKSLDDVYQFYYDLESGYSYTIALRATFWIDSKAEISGIDDTNAWIDVNQIAVWNSPHSHS